MSPEETVMAWKAGAEALTLEMREAPVPLRSGERSSPGREACAERLGTGLCAKLLTDYPQLTWILLLTSLPF